MDLTQSLFLNHLNCTNYDYSSAGYFSYILAVRKHLLKQFEISETLDLFLFFNLIKV
jgi:hypothetical protein